jgi:hypothetical protein
MPEQAYFVMNKFFRCPKARRGWSLIFFHCLILAFLSTPARGTTILEMGLDDMLAAAELVFEGEVINVLARQSASGDAIHTYVTFRITEIIKGRYLKDTIELRFLGGKVGELRLSVSEMHLPFMGEKGIYFVESLACYQVNPLLGWSQGHILVVPDDNGVERVMSRDRRPIIAFEPNAVKQSRASRVRGLSKGVARGLIVGQGAKISGGLSAKEFKTELRRKLEVPE